MNQNINLNNNPLSAPKFESLQEFRSKIEDADFWWPYAAKILEKNNLLDQEHEPDAGVNGTFPTIIYGDVVVKMFGYAHAWRKSFEFDRIAQAAVSRNPAIKVPKMIGEGALLEDPDEPWRYMITTKMTGEPLLHASLSSMEWHTLAEDLGQQFRLIHQIRSQEIPTAADWQNVNVTEAVKQSSLPPHLVEQVDDYLAQLETMSHDFVHGDLTELHVFVENNRLSGIIDWGDAMMMDRHYEIAKLHLDLFECDKSLLRAFLRAYDWEITSDFAYKAMAFSLVRQGLMLEKHHSGDVFFKLPSQFPLHDIATLEQLATILFDIQP